MPVKSIYVYMLESSSATAVTEALDLVFNQNIDSQGLSELVLNYLDPKISLMQQSLDRVISISCGLTKLVIKEMNRVNAQARGHLVALVCQIVQSCASLTHLDLQ